MTARRFSVFFLALFVLLLASCHRAIPPAPESWRVFSYPEYGGTLYAARQENVLLLVVCGSFSGIDASLRLRHECTESQFAVFAERLVEAGCADLGEAVSPDTEGFPDLSVYLSFVLSSNELHELWSRFGLE